MYNKILSVCAYINIMCLLIVHTLMNTIKKKLRHDNHTVSLLTDHMVFSPKYRGKILVDEIAFVTEAVIRSTCHELDIRIIEI